MSHLNRGRDRRLQEGYDGILPRIQASPPAPPRVAPPCAHIWETEADFELTPKPTFVQRLLPITGGEMGVQGSPSGGDR